MNLISQLHKSQINTYAKNINDVKSKVQISIRYIDSNEDGCEYCMFIINGRSKIQNNFEEAIAFLDGVYTVLDFIA